MVRLKDKFETIKKRWIIIIKRTVWIFLVWMMNGIEYKFVGDHVLSTYNRYTWEVTSNYLYYNLINDINFLLI